MVVTWVLSYFVLVTIVLFLLFYVMFCFAVSFLFGLGLLLLLLFCLWSGSSLEHFELKSLKSRYVKNVGKTFWFDIASTSVGNSSTTPSILFLISLPCQGNDIKNKMLVVVVGFFLFCFVFLFFCFFVFVFVLFCFVLLGFFFFFFLRYFFFKKCFLGVSVNFPFVGIFFLLSAFCLHMRLPNL